MGRAHRVDIGDLVYHIVNRANGRVTIFNEPDEYRHFEILLKDAIDRFDMRLLAYVLMPNHWHLVLYPKDGDLLPHNYRTWVNESDKDEDLTDLRTSVNKGKPFGTMTWTERMVERFGLQLTTHVPGRPKKT